MLKGFSDTFVNCHRGLILVLGRHSSSLAIAASADACWPTELVYVTDPGFAVAALWRRRQLTRLSQVAGGRIIRRRQAAARLSCSLAGMSRRREGVRCCRCRDGVHAVSLAGDSTADRPETEGLSPRNPVLRLAPLTTAAGCRARSPRSPCDHCRSWNSGTAGGSAARRRARLHEAVQISVRLMLEAEKHQTSSVT